MTHESLTAQDAPRPLVIVGAGGYGLEVLWVAARITQERAGTGGWNVLGFVDDRASLRGTMIEGLPVLGSVTDFFESHAEWPVHFHCAVGNNFQRQKLAAVFEGRGLKPATLVDPMATVSPRATIAPGAFVAPRVYIGPAARIGRHAILNVSSSIGHHCSIGDFAQICPGARVSGHCTIGRLAFLGSNAVVHPGKRVGESATVSAASFVVRNVRPNTLVIGVPAVTVQQSLPMAGEVSEADPTDGNTPPASITE